jgi:DNA repair exonuclease SbcCD ATPase subunit
MFDALGTGVARVPETDLAQPPLGQMLVERGFITEAQLQQALAEQGRTGLPIGQVLISLSYVTAATIAQALATQEGGVVRTEFGLSTGFDTPGLVALPPVSPATPSPFASLVAAPDPEPEPELVAEPAPEPPAASSTSTRIAELVEQELAHAASAAAGEIAAARGRIAELEQELAHAATASADELSAARTRVAELDHELYGLRQQTDAARAVDDLLAAANVRVAELEQELANAATASANELSAARTRVAELDHELFGLRQRVEAAQTADAALAASQARNAELESALDATRAAASDRIHALETERDARVTELQHTQAQLTTTTENLRTAYERLHQFEIAQALQQHQVQQVQPASQFAWQS